MLLVEVLSTGTRGLVVGKHPIIELRPDIFAVLYFLFSRLTLGIASLDMRRLIADMQ